MRLCVCTSQHQCLDWDCEFVAFRIVVCRCGVLGGLLLLVCLPFPWLFQGSSRRGTYLKPLVGVTFHTVHVCIIRLAVMRPGFWTMQLILSVLRPNACPHNARSRKSERTVCSRHQGSLSRHCVSKCEFQSLQVPWEARCVRSV